MLHRIIISGVDIIVAIICKVRIYESGEFPLDPGVPPLKANPLLESNPMKSRFLVRAWTVYARFTLQEFT